MLVPDQQLAYLVCTINPQVLRVLFLENQNLTTQSLQYLGKNWENLTSLLLGRNRIRQIKGLEQAKFSRLQELCLRGNMLQSIQILIQIDVSNLTKLILKNNKISTFRSLRRLYIPKLAHLALQKNQAKQLRLLNQIQCPSLKTLHIQFTNTKCLDQDMRWFFKLQSNCISELYCQSYRRIESEQIRAMIQKRFVLIENR